MLRCPNRNGRLWCKQERKLGRSFARWFTEAASTAGQIPGTASSLNLGAGSEELQAALGA